MRSGGAPPETSTIPSSPAARLPQEIVDMIVAYLTRMVFSLHACSLISRSWYVAAVPHLRPTLCITFGHDHRNLEWSNPIWSTRVLGSVKCVQFYGVHSRNIFSPRLFNSQLLCQFSASTSLETLEIHKLDIPSFITCIQPYFGHCLPTVRYLSLTAPEGSCRQIIFFIGLFQNLGDLSLINIPLDIGERKPADDLTLIPFFTPPLGGRLVVSRVARAGLLEYMIRLFGGIRFGHLDLFDVNETQLLLDACANTLRRLDLYPTDPRGEQPCPSFT